MIPLFVMAQTAPPIMMGSKLYEFRNGLRVDSAFFIPRKDTLFFDNTMKAPGMLTWRPADSTLYIYRGDRWASVFSSETGLLDSLYARIDTIRGDNRYILNRNYPKQDADANVNALTADTLTISYPTAPNISNRQTSGVVGVPGRSLSWFPTSSSVSYAWWTTSTFWDMALRRGSLGKVELWIGQDTTTRSTLKVKAQGAYGINNVFSLKDTAGVRFLSNFMLHNDVPRYSFNDSIPPYWFSYWINGGVGINKDSIPITSSPSAVPLGIDTVTGQVVRFIDGGSGSYIQNLYSTTTPQSTANATIDGSYFSIDGTIDLSSINTPSGATVSTKPKVLVARTVDPASNVSDHTFADNSIFRKNVDAIGYNSYDAWPQINGSSNYDHYSAVQSRPVYNTTGVTANHFGFYDVPTINAGSTLTNRFAIYVADAVGAGTVTNNYGIFVNTMTKGTNNYSIYTGTATTRLGGTLQMANSSGAVSSGALINFTSGSSSAVEASINHEVISTTQGNLRFKVRTATGTPPTGMTEVLTFIGGSSYGVGINNITPSAKLHVVGTTRFDLGSDAKWDGFYRDSATGNVTRDPAGTFGQFRYAGPGGKPVWRTLVAGDIPSLPFSQITGTVPVAQGGTGLTALGSALQQIRVNAGATALEYFTPATPTLDQVTTAGATTTNNVSVGTIAMSSAAVVATGTYGYQNVKLNNSTNRLDRYSGEFVDFVTLSTSSTNAGNAEYYINTNNTARTVVIPVATGDNQGRRYTIINSNADTGGTTIVENVTVDLATNAVRVNGSTANITIAPGGSLTIVSNGVQWYGTLSFL